MPTAIKKPTATVAESLAMGELGTADEKLTSGENIIILLSVFL